MEYKPYQLPPIWYYPQQEPGLFLCTLLGIRSDYAQPITGQVTEVICPVIGRAQPEPTLPCETQLVEFMHEIHQGTIKGQVVTILMDFKQGLR